MTSPTSEFEQWWDGLPNGWPASRGYHDLAEAVWNASRDVTAAPLREEAAELTAEVARLKAELDLKDADHHTIHVTSVNLQMAMTVCKGEDPGTVLRETDGQRRDYVLGEDMQWTAR